MNKLNSIKVTSKKKQDFLGIGLGSIALTIALILGSGFDKKAVAANQIGSTCQNLDSQIFDFNIEPCKAWQQRIIDAFKSAKSRGLIGENIKLGSLDIDILTNGVIRILENNNDSKFFREDGTIILDIIKARKGFYIQKGIASQIAGYKEMVKLQDGTIKETGDWMYNYYKNDNKQEEDRYEYKENLRGVQFYLVDLKSGLSIKSGSIRSSDAWLNIEYVNYILNLKYILNGERGTINNNTGNTWLHDLTRNFKILRPIHLERMLAKGTITNDEFEYFIKFFKGPNGFLAQQLKDKNYIYLVGKYSEEKITQNEIENYIKKGILPKQFMEIFLTNQKLASS